MLLTRFHLASLFVFIIFIGAHTSKAQSLEVGLKSGDVLKPLKLELDEINFEDVYLLVDGEKISPDDISYYQNEEGYYKWYIIRQIDAGFRVKRVVSGKISTFARVDQTYASDGTVDGEARDKHSGYFMKGNGDLETIEYANLKAAVKDNATALAHLEKLKKTNEMARIGFGVGAACIFGGIFHTLYDANRNNGSASFSPFFIPGLALATGAVIIRLPYRKKLRQTVDIYNQ